MLKFFVDRTDQVSKPTVQLVESGGMILGKTQCSALEPEGFLFPDYMYSAFIEVEDADSFCQWITEYGDLDYWYETEEILAFYFRLVDEEDLLYIEVFDRNLHLLYQVDISDISVGFSLRFDEWEPLDHVFFSRLVGGQYRRYDYSDFSQTERDTEVMKILDRQPTVHSFAELHRQHWLQKWWSYQEQVEHMTTLVSLLVSPYKRYDIQFTESQQRFLEDLPEYLLDTRDLTQFFWRVVDCFVVDESKRETIFLELDFYPDDPSRFLANK